MKPSDLSEATKKLLDANIDDAVECACDQYHYEFNKGLLLCESHIEMHLLAALMFIDGGYSNESVWIWDSLKNNKKPSVQIVISPQYRIEKYRVDFAIFAEDFSDNVLHIVVECDGHDFHERTKKQAARDRSRDRRIQALGWKVMRFTGAEIHNDAMACANEVSQIVSDFIELDLYKTGRSTQLSKHLRERLVQ